MNIRRRISPTARPAFRARTAGDLTISSAISVSQVTYHRRSEILAAWQGKLHSPTRSPRYQFMPERRCLFVRAPASGATRPDGGIAGDAALVCALHPAGEGFVGLMPYRARTVHSRVSTAITPTVIGGIRIRTDFFKGDGRRSVAAGADERRHIDSRPAPT